MKNIRTFTSFMLFILLQQNLFDIYIKFTIDVRTDVLLHGRRPEVAFSSYQWPHLRWSVRSQTIPQPDAVSVHRRRVLASDILYPEDGPKFYSRLDLGQGYKVARGRARWILSSSLKPIALFTNCKVGGCYSAWLKVTMATTAAVTLLKKKFMIMVKLF